MSLVVLSAYVAIATNCLVVALVIDTLAGVTSIELGLEASREEPLQAKSAVTKINKQNSFMLFIVRKPPAR